MREKAGARTPDHVTCESNRRSDQDNLSVATVRDVTSSTHDGLIAMFRDNPDFLTEVLDENLGIPLPPFTDSVAGNCDLTEIVSTEYRADAVVTRYRDGEPVLAVIVEAQRKRDARKRETWPVYVATVHARLHCPVLLLVVCPNASVAAWSAEPIVIFEPGLTLRPIVFGPPPGTGHHRHRAGPAAPPR